MAGEDMQTARGGHLAPEAKENNSGMVQAGNQVKGKEKLGARQWADLFKSKSKPSTCFKLQKWEEEDRGIKEEELRDLGVCLVGFILGRFPGMYAIDQMMRSWNVECSFTVHEHGWIVFRFKEEVDRDMVLQKGPYESNGAVWILKKMPKFFKFSDDSLNMVPTWVRLPALPLEFWSPAALGKIVSSVGEPIAADDCTAEMLKTSYARVLVEVDITKPLVRQVTVQMPDGDVMEQKVIYEREPKFCLGCRFMGHVLAECRRQGIQKQQSGGEVQISKIVQEGRSNKEQQQPQFSKQMTSLPGEDGQSRAQGKKPAVNQETNQQPNPMASISGVKLPGSEQGTDAIEEVQELTCQNNGEGKEGQVGLEDEDTGMEIGYAVHIETMPPASPDTTIQMEQREEAEMANTHAKGMQKKRQNRKRKGGKGGAAAGTPNS